MRLTLIRDGDVGTPLGETNISDHPDESELGDALDAIAEDATYTLVTAPAEAAKAAEEKQKAEAKEAEDLQKALDKKRGEK